jgi:hypothetical protein
MARRMAKINGSANSKKGDLAKAAGFDQIRLSEAAIVIDYSIENDLRDQVIRVLCKRSARDIVEVGRRLNESKSMLKHGQWLPWLEREFGWSERTARNYMHVQLEVVKSARLADLNTTIEGLFLIAAPSTSDEVREQAVERSERGEGGVNDTICLGCSGTKSLLPR